MLTNNASLIDQISEQMKHKRGDFEWGQVPLVVEVLPPLVLAAEAATDPQHLSWEDYQLTFYSEDEALPNMTLHRGTVAQVFRFLKERPSEILLDFAPLGKVHFHHGELRESGKNKGKLQAWLRYALSPELWGPQGKWTRFHERLHTLFSQNHLIKGENIPGHYILSSDQLDWEKLGIKGDLIEGGLLELTIPWHFPLSALKKLEDLIKET